MTIVASVISIQEECGANDFWTIKSTDLPGLLLHGKDLEKIRKCVPVAIKGLFKLNYKIDVSISPVVKPKDILKCVPENFSSEFLEWAVFPASD